MVLQGSGACTCAARWPPCKCHDSAPTAPPSLPCHGAQAALINSAIVGGTLFAFTIVAIRLVDRAGRRPLLFSGNAVMTASMVGAVSG